MLVVANRFKYTIFFNHLSTCHNKLNPFCKTDLHLFCKSCDQLYTPFLTQYAAVQ